jgi:hypothetical protein
MANGDYATELLFRWTLHARSPMQTATTRLTD